MTRKCMFGLVCAALIAIHSSARAQSDDAANASSLDRTQSLDDTPDHDRDRARHEQDDEVTQSVRQALRSDGDVLTLDPHRRATVLVLPANVTLVVIHGAEQAATDIVRPAAGSQDKALDGKGDQATTQLALSRQQLAEKNQALTLALNEARRELVKSRAAEQRALAAQIAAEAANRELSRILGDKAQESGHTSRRSKQPDIKGDRIHDDLEDIP